MQDWIKWTNRYTTPCEETPRNNLEGGKRKTKKNKEEQREPLTDVNLMQDRVRNRSNTAILGVD